MKAKETTVRLDQAVQRQLSGSIEQARRMIMAGLVHVDGIVIDKPGAMVLSDASVVITELPAYVSRGGYKLERALDLFQVDGRGMVVADIGASTGGFTDVWLQRGAARVYAIDVGYGQLAWELRQDARVVVMDRTNARYLNSLPEEVDRISVDVSFISLGLILPRARGWLRPGGQAVALVKPQFEASAELVGKGGVVHARETHRLVLKRVLSEASADGWQLLGLTRSPLVGPAGNIEFLAWLGKDTGLRAMDSEQELERAIANTVP
ncbi:MAG: TlyA family RNA methyltransferase [Chloroflexi bacterium]|nr:TlyA family RNA methyltransferase [Chloroflexota bacterium]